MAHERSLLAAIDRRATTAPAALALVDDDGTTLTAAQLRDAAATLAGRLHAAGTRAGDRVAWHGRNHRGTVVTLLAAQHLGAVFAPLSFRAAPRELADAFALLEPRVVVTTPDVVTAPWGDAGPRHLPWADDDAAPEAPRAPLDDDDLAVLLCTSGSSGRPKAVMLSHTNLWWSTHNLEDTLDLRADDVALAAAPLFHVGGLNGVVLGTLARGGTVLLRAGFDPARTLVDLRDHGVTTMFGVPAMFGAVALEPGFDDADLSGLRAGIVGGAPVPTALLRAWTARGARLHASWGMTETAPAGTLVRDPWSVPRPCGIGTPLPYLEARLVEVETGAEVTGPGRVGELTVRGPQVMLGYWRDPAATDAALRDGWLRTGDLATWDTDGALRISGRLTEVVNTGGEKVPPVEVEAALADLDVEEVVVVGVPDPAWGEVVVAVVVPHTGRPVDLATARELAGRSIARYKLPKHLVELADLPRTASGKVDRRAVRELAAYLLGRRVAAPCVVERPPTR
jgi:fatty-acyl-CoA synthase